ncbi:hypothetical protein Tco_0007470 [Tanacetum coccineum]
MRDIVRSKIERELVRVKIHDGNAFWNEIGVNAGATAKVKTVNGERQLQALVDKKKVIITETSIRSDLKLDDASGTDCLPTATIFEELARMGAKTTAWNEFSSTMASAIICLDTNQNCNMSKYIVDAMLGDMLHHKKTYVNPSHTKKIFANMKREEKDFSRKVTPLFATMMVQANQEEGANSATPTDSHSTPIISQPSSSKPKKKKSRRKQRKDSAPTEPTTEETPDEAHSRVLALETTKSNQALEIESLKRRVKSLEKRLKSRTPGFKRLRKVGSASRVESSNDVSLGAQEDASKQGRKIVDLDADAKEKDVGEKEVSAADPVTTAGEVVTTANLNPAITSAATTTMTTRPKAKGVVVQEPKEDQVALDEEIARNLEAQLQAELIEEERIARQKEEEANIDLLESWDNTQAIMDVDFQLAQQMQIKEQEQLSIEEKSKLFVELLEKRKKHFAALRAQEKRSKPPTKAQKRNTMSTYLKNMAGYKHNQLKSKSYDEIQEMFDKEMKRVNTFVDMNTELVKGSKTKAEGSSKRAGDELEQEKAKKQKGDDDQEEAEMKRHIEIVKDDEVAIDAIPLATKPPVIVDYKIDKDGRMGYFKLIRADGSSKRYSSMIKMLQGIDREDLETLWKLVKAKHENTRPEDDYERVL